MRDTELKPSMKTRNDKNEYAVEAKRKQKLDAQAAMSPHRLPFEVFAVNHEVAFELFSFLSPSSKPVYSARSSMVARVEM